MKRGERSADERQKLRRPQDEEQQERDEGQSGGKPAEPIDSAIVQHFIEIGAGEIVGRLSPERRSHRRRRAARRAGRAN